MSLRHSGHVTALTDAIISNDRFFATHRIRAIVFSVSSTRLKESVF
jgi:hypothetical protein